jgi:serine protease Do
MGIVSAVGRVNEDNGAATYIQTDAAINAGSSGGALVDMQGNLVGITSFMMTEGGGSEDLGFALPAKLVYSVFEALKKNGEVKYGDVGIRAQNITPVFAAGLQLSQEWGIVVSDVDPGSSAADAGVQDQDIIESLDGEPLSSSPQFVAALYNKKPRDHVRLSILRGARRLSVDLVVRDYHRASDDSLETANLDGGVVSKLGVVCVPLSKEDLTSNPPVRLRA